MKLLTKSKNHTCHKQEEVNNTTDKTTIVFKRSDFARAPFIALFQVTTQNYHTLLGNKQKAGINNKQSAAIF